MTRRFALVLGTAFMLIAALACNLPSEIDPKIYTQTVAAIASATAVANATSTTIAENSFMTQTAVVAPPASATDTPPALSPLPSLALTGDFPTISGPVSTEQVQGGGATPTVTATTKAGTLKIGMAVKITTT